MHIYDLPTPALLLDLEILENNLLRMQDKINSLGSRLRPHMKTHKCVDIANRQRAIGAKGITVSTFYEAKHFAEAGFDDITWAFPLPPVYAGSVVDLAKKVTIRVVVDSKEAKDRLEEASRGGGISLHVWMKVDCGNHRAGVDPASPAAEELVHALSESKSLLFDGILSHSGHAYDGKSRAEILAVANQERTVMTDFAERMTRKGYRIPAISIGSTPSMAMIDNLEGITEVRPGNYCFYDHTMVALDVCAVQNCAVTLLASVISHQKGASHFVIDAGALALSKDIGASHRSKEMGMGAIYDDYKQKRLHENINLRTLSQEHGKVVVDDPRQIEGKFPVGDRVRILENHSCLTIAHFDEYFIVKGDDIVDRWKIARGRT